MGGGVENEHKKKTLTTSLTKGIGFLFLRSGMLSMPNIPPPLKIKKYGYSSNEKQKFGEEQLHNNMVQTVKKKKMSKRIIPRFGPWMFVMVSIDILLKG